MSIKKQLDEIRSSTEAKLHPIIVDFIEQTGWFISSIDIKYVEITTTSDKEPVYKISHIDLKT